MLVAGEGVPQGRAVKPIFIAEDLQGPGSTRSDLDPPQVDQVRSRRRWQYS